jgi:hypothetical protein
VDGGIRANRSPSVELEGTTRLKPPYSLQFKIKSAS